MAEAALGSNSDTFKRTSRVCFVSMLSILSKFKAGKGSTQSGYFRSQSVNGLDKSVI